MLVLGLGDKVTIHESGPLRGAWVLAEEIDISTKRVKTKGVVLRRLGKNNEPLRNSSDNRRIVTEDRLIDLLMKEEAIVTQRAA